METCKFDKGSCLDGCLIDNHTRKLLPCFHVFCVEYLREFNRGKPSNKNACPRCRVTFTVPKRDLDNLPGNFFGRRLEELNRISQDGKMRAQWETETKGETEMACDVCRSASGNYRSGKSVSVAYCLDCRQNLCETCLSCHRRMRLSRSHQVLEASVYNAGSVTELLSGRDRPCEAHQSEMERVFCEICEVPKCTKCCAEERHRGHGFVPVSRISEDARVWIVSKLDRIEEAKVRAEQLLESVEEDSKRFLENLECVEMEIEEIKSQILDTVSTDALALREELNVHNEKHTDETTMLDDEIRRKCFEFEQLTDMVGRIRDLIPDSVTPQVAEIFNRIAVQLTKPPEFHDQMEYWMRARPRVDHLLPKVNEVLNDDFATVTGNIGELELVIKTDNSCLE